MIENYDDATVEQTLSAVESFDTTRLQQFLVYEREHKNRKGVIEGIRDELITVRCPSEGYYGGHWFDAGGEHVVRDSTRIRRSFDRTALELVEE